MRPESIRRDYSSAHIRRKLTLESARRQRNFDALQVSQRPTIVIDSPIGDRAVFSGFAKIAPLAATIDAMLDDIVGYRSARGAFRFTRRHELMVQKHLASSAM